MPQLSLRLVPSVPARPGVGGVGCTVAGGAAPVAAGSVASASAAARGARAVTLDRLRALVGARGRAFVPPPEPFRPEELELAPGASSTGIAGLDAWLRGWPRPGVIELAGPPGAGRLALVLPLLESLTRQGRSALLVDPLHQVHPPGLGRVDPARLVLVRPPGERASWVAEQVARSGAVEAMLVIDSPPLGRGGVRLARAAEAGGMLVFVMAGRPESDLPASLRLEVGGWQGPDLRVRCTRCRDGRMLGERLVSMRPVVHPSQPVAITRPAERVELLRAGRG